MRCAPPDNKPLPQELAECSHFLDRELAGLKDVKVVVALGKIGFDAYLNYMKRRGLLGEQEGLRLQTWRQLPDARRQGVTGVVPSVEPEHADRQTDAGNVRGGIQAGGQTFRLARVVAGTLARLVLTLILDSTTTHQNQSQNQADKSVRATQPTSAYSRSLPVETGASSWDPRRCPRSWAYPVAPECWL